MSLVLIVPAVVALVAVAGPTGVPAHVESIETTVQRLAPLFARPVSVSPKLRGTLVFLQPNGASAQKSLEALAQALHASIASTPSGMVLQRTESDTRQAEQVRVSERTRWLQSKIDDVSAFRDSCTKGRSLSPAIIAEVNKAVRVSEAIAKGLRQSPDPEFASELLPAEGLLMSLVAHIGKEKIAAVPIGQIGIWEDSPVFGAKPLPEHKDALRTYQSKIDTLKGSELSPGIKVKLDSLGLTQFFSDWDQATPPVRLRLEVRAEETMSVVSLTGYDHSGNQVLASALICLPEKVWRPPALIVKAELEDKNAHWVSLSSGSADAASISSEDLVSHPPNWFTNPDAHEPLDLFVGDSLRAVAAQMPGKCMAAQVCDGLWDDARVSTVKGRLDVEAFESMLKKWSRYERLETDACIVWRPKGSIESTRCQADRMAMGGFARTALSTKAVDLRRLAEFHERSGPTQTNLTVYWSRVLRGASSLRSLSGDATHGFYQMIGSISDEDWLRLTSGRPSTVGALGIQKSFSALLDEDRTLVQFSRPFPATLRHPRESFPDGSIQGSSLTVSCSRHELLGVRSPQGDGVVQWSEGIPMLSVLSVRNDPINGPTLSMTREEYENWLRALKFQFGTQDGTTVVVSFPNGTFESATFVDPIVPTTALVSCDDLPAATRDAIWRKARESATPATGRGSVPASGES